MIGGQGTVRCCALVASLGLCTGAVLADGTETLGPPSIVIAEGSDIIVAGVGLANGQPDDINVTVGPGLTVEQVILYWEGFANTAGEQGDTDTIMVNMIPVTGTRIGGPTNFFGTVWTSTYREDITALGQVGAGDNTLTIEGLDFGNVNDGAGVVVIVSDGENTVIDLRDGNDTAFINFPAPRCCTVPQTFTFPAADEDRTAKFRMFFSSVSLAQFRPSIIRFSIDGVFAEDICDELNSNDGPDWDTFTNELTIPAGATSVTVEAISGDCPGDPTGLPASFVWNAAALALLPPGACCLPDGTCVQFTEEDCEAAGGTFQGVGTDCGEPEACCLKDGTCLDMDPLCCELMGGSPQGPGSMCSPDGPQACCLPDDSCVNVDPICCEYIGGEPQGPGTNCEMNPCDDGGEGCTPGYWKQMQHFDSWPDQYDPLTTTFAEVFGNDVYGARTLLQVLATGGGGLKALGRHAVAALLNAASDGVAYGLTPQEVIDAFNDVVPGDGDEQEALKDFFEGLNEQGCPLN